MGQITDINLKTASTDELTELLKLYPWFTTARVLRCKQDSQNEPLLKLSAYKCYINPQIELPPQEAFVRAAQLSLIERFLTKREQRPKIDNQDVEADNYADQSVEEDPDLATEELAEIYLKQNHKDKAKKIYQRLSLLYPEKSVYFAEIMERID